MKTYTMVWISCHNPDNWIDDTKFSDKEVKKIFDKAEICQADRNEIESQGEVYKNGVLNILTSHSNPISEGIEDDLWIRICSRYKFRAKDLEDMKLKATEIYDNNIPDSEVFSVVDSNGRTVLTEEEL